MQIGPRTAFAIIERYTQTRLNQNFRFKLLDSPPAAEASTAVPLNIVPSKSCHEKTNRPGYAPWLLVRFTAANVPIKLTANTRENARVSTARLICRHDSQYPLQFPLSGYYYLVTAKLLKPKGITKQSSSTFAVVGYFSKLIACCYYFSPRLSTRYQTTKNHDLRPYSNPLHTLKRVLPFIWSQKPPCTAWPLAFITLAMVLI